MSCVRYFDSSRALVEDEIELDDLVIPSSVVVVRSVVDDVPSAEIELR